MCHWKRRTLREILGKQKCTLTTYNIPLHVVHTKDPIVTFIYVGPLCKQSKHCLLTGKAASSLKSFVFLSSAVLLLAAILCYYRKLHSSHWYSLDRSYKISIFFFLSTVLDELNPPVVAGASLLYALFWSKTIKMEFKPKVLFVKLISRNINVFNWTRSSKSLSRDIAVAVYQWIPWYSLILVIF